MDAEIRYLLKLFVAGGSARSEQAIANLRRFCKDNFLDGYELVIVDILTHPEAAEAQKILAVPTLIKELPLPARRIVGDLSDDAKVLDGMGLLAT